MDYEFWDNCWGRPTQPFHLIQPHHFLTQYFSTYFADQERVLLPLCGKTQDLNYLAQQGITAVGVEFNPIAVESFFESSQLKPRIEHFDHGKCYQADHTELWLADFFELKQQDLGLFNRIFDRASLVALPEALRAAYAKHLVRLVKPGGKVLLVTMDYDETEMSGPPFLVSKLEIEALYPQSKVKELDRFSILDSHPRWQELELSHLDEVLYEIQIN